MRRMLRADLLGAPFKLTPSLNGFPDAVVVLLSFNNFMLCSANCAAVAPFAHTLFSDVFLFPFLPCCQKS